LVATNSTDLIAEVRGLTPNILVSFSRGKDSLATYLRVRDKFERVVPYTYEVIPDLEFVNESLAYYEGKMGCRIMRFPAPGLPRLLNNFVYQPPDRIAAIEEMAMPVFTHDHLQESACEDAGLDYRTAYNALGLRAADSAMRAMVIKKYGAVNHTRRIFYPVFDYTKDEVLASIRTAGWKLPLDYRYFSASFDGMYAKFMVPIKRHFPRDWARILEWFPLLELEVLRFESAVKRGDQPAYEFKGAAA
jgi:3'-phosphoadenosine 5'-phosphosulfate sulfotransferase (PAPS reductase)/FAD synthetase